MRRVLVVLSLAAACTSTPDPAAPSSSASGALQVRNCRTVPFESVPPTGASVVTVTQSGSAATPAAPAPAPKVQLGAPMVSAGGDAAAIAATLDGALPALRRCYQNTLETLPGLEGKLTLGVKIQASGQVSADGKAGFHPGVTACVEEVVRALRFTAAKADVEATVALTFRLPDDAPATTTAPAPATTSSSSGAPPATSVPPAVNPPSGPVAAPPAPVFPGSAGDYATSIVALAIEQRSAAIIGCARPGDRPVQLGFDVTVAVRGAAIANASVDGLVDPAVEMCIAGVLRGAALPEATPAPTGTRCDMLLRTR